MLIIVIQVKAGSKAATIVVDAPSSILGLRYLALIISGTFFARSSCISLPSSVIMSVLFKAVRKYHGKKEMKLRI